MIPLCTSAVGHLALPDDVCHMRLARVNITVQDDLYDQAKRAALNVSQLAQRAIASELARLAKIAAKRPAIVPSVVLTDHRRRHCRRRGRSHCALRWSRRFTRPRPQHRQRRPDRTPLTTPTAVLFGQVAGSHGPASGPPLPNLEHACHSQSDRDKVFPNVHFCAGVAPTVNQIPWRPSHYDARPLAEHTQRGIVVEGYSGLKRSELVEPLKGGALDSLNGQRGFLPIDDQHAGLDVGDSVGLALSHPSMRSRSGARCFS